MIVSSRGFLKFAGPLDPNDGANSDAKLADNRIIAPFWANLRTDGTGNDIFVDVSVADQVTIRWNATSVADGSHSVILPQVTFGIAVRMAVMCLPSRTSLGMTDD